MRILFLVFTASFLVFIQTTIKGQNWSAFGEGFNLPVKCVFSDSTDSCLYAAGSFSMSGNDTVYGVASWNGTNWASFPNTIADCHVVSKYSGNLYACGQFFLPNPYHFIVMWNGVSWDSIARIYGGTIVKLKEYNNELYACGLFNNIAGLQGSNIVKWNGTTWSALKDTAFNGIINDFIEYNGELHIVGNFYNGTTGVWRISKWNGINWIGLANGGIYGGMDDVSSLAIFQNELYVAGAFTKSSGNVGNYIQKWDGVSWSEVGGGVMGIAGGNGQIHQLKVIDNKLYAVGIFSYAGGIPAQYVGYWDGINWCGLGSLFDNRISCVVSYDDNLVIAGAFRTIDSDTVNSIAKWTGGNYVDTCGHITIGVNEIPNQNNFILYPNPASASITIESTMYAVQSIKIVDVLGRGVYYLQTQNNKTEIDVSHLPSGVYFVKAQNKDNVLSKKFVKQ